jgi:hypothetical protein
MAKSVRYSCAIDQKPLSTKIGHLVVIKAVIITIKRGIETNLVNNPSNIKVLQIISKVPVKQAQNAGWLNPIFKNLPAPNDSGNKNFCIPSERNINPTVILINSSLLSFTVLKMNDLSPFSVFMIISIENIHLYLNFKILVFIRVINLNLGNKVMYHING